MKYYPIEIILENRTFLIIWYTGDKDGVICENGKVVWFSSAYNLSCYCKKHNIRLEDDSSVFDLTKPINQQHIDFSNILDFWNLILDVSSSIELPFLGSAENGIVLDVYNKLLYGSNPEVIVEGSSHFVPTFSNAELAILLDVFENGMTVLKGSLA